MEVSSISETEAAARWASFGNVSEISPYPPSRLSPMVMILHYVVFCIVGFVLAPRLVIVRLGAPLFYYVIITLQHKPAPISIRRIA